MTNSSNTIFSLFNQDMKNEEPTDNTIKLSTLVKKRIPKPENSTPETPTTDLKYIDYSPKAFAIIGNTKPIKDKLKNLGGRFNPFLTCGAGWIFSKSKETTVKQLLNL
jgi:hypothetical protein